MRQFLLAVPHVVLYGCAILIAAAFAMSVALLWQTWRVKARVRKLTKLLAEFGDAYCHQNDRADFVSLYRSLANHPRVKIIPAETRLFQRGVDFFEQRSDKNWSLTDCISFVPMRDERITEALTGDNHFEEAGIVALLK